MRTLIKPFLPFLLSFVYQFTSAQAIDTITVEIGSDNIWQNRFRFINTYNANCQIAISISYEWQSTASIWQPSVKTMYTYNNAGIQTEALYQRWNIFSNIWENSDRYISVYKNKYNSVDSSLYWSFDRWANSYRVINKWDDNRNKLSYVFEYYTIDIWEKAGRGLFSYDLENRLISFEYDDFEAGQWVKSSLWKNSYGIDTRVDSGYYWGNSEWKLGNKINYSLKINTDLPLSTLSQRLDSNNIWQNTNRQTFKYNRANS